MGRRRLKLTIAYLGTGYHGFAVQPGVPTIGGALVEAISRVVGHEIELTCAGRTDAGVHAWCQVIHCDVATRVEPGALQRSVNKMLGGRIVVRNAEVAGEGFDARRSARARRYAYTILNSSVPSPFLAATAWHVEYPLDLHALILSADPLIGEHDFSSFCRRPPDKSPDDPIVRRVVDARWAMTTVPYATSEPGRQGTILRFEITASSFCHQMVRSVVGTMVEMGRERRRAGEMAAILRSRDRTFAASPAPPHGLCLEEVFY